MAGRLTPESGCSERQRNQEIAFRRKPGSTVQPIELLMSGSRLSPGMRVEWENRMVDDIAYLPATRLIELYRAKQLSPVAVMSETLASIQL